MRPRPVASTVVPPPAEVRRCPGLGWLVRDPDAGVVTVLDPGLDPVLGTDLPDADATVSGCGAGDLVVVAVGSRLAASDRGGTVRWERDVTIDGCHIDAAGRLWAFEPGTGRLLLFEAATGRPLGAVDGCGLGGSAEFRPHPDGVHLGVVTGRADDGAASWWATPGRAGPAIRPLPPGRLLAVAAEGTRYVMWHRYRLTTAEFPSGRPVADVDASWSEPPGALVCGSLLLMAGHRTGQAEHVVLSAGTLVQRAVVDYGYDAPRLVGSHGSGTWLTVDGSGRATVWALDWPLVPIEGQLALL